MTTSVRLPTRYQRLMYHKSVLLALCAVTLSVPSFASSQDAAPEVEIYAASIRAVRGTAARAPVLLVHNGSTDTTLAHRIAARIGASVRGVADSRTCKGGVAPQCGWQLRGDTVAFRARVTSLTSSRASVIVDSWGRLPVVKSGQPSGFFEQWRIELTKEGTAWTVAKRVQTWAM